MRRRAAMLALLLAPAMAPALAPVLAWGQSGADETMARFRALLQAPRHRTAVVEAAGQSPAWSDRGCRTATFKLGTSAQVWVRPDFDATGKPLAGLWGEAVTASGCGETRRLNVVTEVRSPGTLVTSPLLPGNTEADPVLQQGAARDAFAAALGHVPGCQQAVIDDTRVVPGEPRAAGQVHREQWIVLACGQSVTTELQFVPAPSGTDVVARVL